MTPVWSQLYNKELQEPVDSYQYKDSDFACSSPRFTELLVENSGNTLIIKYTGLIGEPLDLVEIQCQNWRNPVAAKEVTSIVLKTLDLNL